MKYELLQSRNLSIALGSWKGNISDFVHGFRWTIHTDGPNCSCTQSDSEGDRSSSLLVNFVIVNTPPFGIFDRTYILSIVVASKKFPRWAFVSLRVNDSGEPLGFLRMTIVFGLSPPQIVMS